MQSNQIPDKFLIPFANNASASYVRSIPQSSQVGITPGAASLETGFPPLNFEPVGSGGVPPFGADMNGILRMITSWLRWAATGGLPTFDQSFATAVGGYPRGALLASTTPGLVWVSAIENNATNPDGGGAVGWQSLLTTAAVPPTALVHAGVDTGTTANQIVIPVLIPTVASLDNYQIYEIVPNVSVTGATSVRIGSFGAVALKRADGADLQSGDAPAGQPLLAMFLNGVLRRVGLCPSDISTNVSITNYLRTYITQVALAARIKIATSSETWTVPSDTYAIRRARTWGGGGSGGGSTGANGAGSGGGGGGYHEFGGAYAVTPGQQVGLVVGQGGPPASNANGNAGGTTSIGLIGQTAWQAATGGGPGAWGNNQGSGPSAGFGGVGTGPGLSGIGGAGSFSIGYGSIPGSGIGGAGAFGGGSPTPNVGGGSSMGNFPGGGSNGGSGGSDSTAGAGGLIVFEY